jgi:predicted ATP-grasp superfamily ATP-dependent carboligase
VLPNKAKVLDGAELVDLQDQVRKLNLETEALNKEAEEYENENKTLRRVVKCRTKLWVQ